MKNINLIFIFILHTFVIFSQEFSPIGSKWIYELIFEQSHPPFNKYYDRYEIASIKDTIINRKDYKILSRTTKRNFLD